MATDLPKFIYTMGTADGCELATTYQHDGSRLVEHAGKWQPEEPFEHTDWAQLQVIRGNSSITLKLSGDQHRDIDSWGLFDGMLQKIVDGTPAVDALESTLAEARNRDQGLLDQLADGIEPESEGMRP